MKLEPLKPGVYVLAVSGGVDSIVLLNLASDLSKQSHQHKFVVAHLDHGIRSDSNQDRILVENYSRRLDLPFVYERVSLGSEASEETARNARYDFLFK
ncbi:MAG TPA: ATP-binding protein, partial [Candidatus Sulfotelmatobacter sp.]|nr:ATP-binding protein [Candidatus Sulfotelmatobacter sp.]